MSGLDEQDDEYFYDFKNLPPPPDLVKAKVWLEYRERILKYLRKRIRNMEG